MIERSQPLYTTVLSPELSTMDRCQYPLVGWKQLALPKSSLLLAGDSPPSPFSFSRSRKRRVANFVAWTAHLSQISDFSYPSMDICVMFVTRSPFLKEHLTCSLTWSIRSHVLIHARAWNDRLTALVSVVKAFGFRKPCIAADRV